MSKPNYRAIVSFDPERKVFQARAPELEHCSAEGATRLEAITRLEEEIDAQLANMLSHGTAPPRSVDEESFSGEISAKLSRALHKELTYQARSEGIPIDQLVAELIAQAVEARKHGARPRGGNSRPVDEHRGYDGNRRGYGNSRNTQLLDDRASFIEYVRGLEQGGGRPGPNGGHGGNNDPRRRRGGRGGRGGGFRDGRGPGGPNRGHGHGGPQQGAPAQGHAHDDSGDADGNS